ncbi:MAG TPA: type II toxin-antitoxin system RelE/ParE family toxin [Dehalococcoidia bacterium]|nr:type II toxin-antitoxin system RelE/ParE family toxin [Dehalococcoidia bacterium]
MSDVAPAYAAPLVAAISASMDAVADFPNSGRMVPEFHRDRLREVIFENYRIVYSVLGDDLFVVGVFHGARDVAALLREMGEAD